MTDIAVRPSIAGIMTAEALIVDINRVRTQLEYFGAVEDRDGTVTVIETTEAPQHLISTWGVLVAEARLRGYDI